MDEFCSTKVMLQDLKDFIKLCNDGKRYKSIAKGFDVYLSVVGQIVYKRKNNLSSVASLPRNGRPVKMTARATMQNAQ